LSSWEKKEFRGQKGRKKWPPPPREDRVEGRIHLGFRHKKKDDLQNVGERGSFWART